MLLKVRSRVAYDLKIKNRTILNCTKMLCQEISKMYE